MNTFKVGDTVYIINPCSTYPFDVGTKGVIQQTYPSSERHKGLYSVIVNNTTPIFSYGHLIWGIELSHTPMAMNMEDWL